MRRSLYLLVFLLIIITALTSCQIIAVDTSEKYVERGDNRFDLGKYEDAIAYYIKAIEANPNNATAYNNIAASLTYLDRPEEALEYCEKAIEIEPTMIMPYNNMGLALNNLARYEEAIEYYDKAISLNENNDFAYSNKGDALLYLERYEEALRSFRKAAELKPDDSSAYFGQALCNYYLEHYNGTISLCNKSIQLDEGYLEAYLWKAKAQIKNNDYDEALDTLKLVVSNSDAFYLKSIALFKKEMYSEALEAVEAAIGLDEYYFDAYMTKLSILYKQQNFDECIEFGKAALEIFPNNEDVLWYIADSYSSLYKYEEAIEGYKKVLKVNPQNEGVLGYLGWSYYFLQDYDNAWKVLNEVLAVNKESDIAAELKSALEEVKLPEGRRIVNFVKNYYLYFDNIKDFDKKSESLAQKTDVTYKDIEEYLKMIIPKNDYFTFVLHGKDYDALEGMEMEDQIEHRAYGADSYYIRIKAFNAKSGHEFAQIIEAIDSRYHNLILDLRDNTGGYTEASSQILDTLLPLCTSSTLVYRDGNEEEYKSDAQQKKYKNIIIFVNENSASSSELLTLGLKLKLDNVTIIGTKTYGKGVGQEIFENKKKKYIIFLVSFYWNINNQNINGEGIVPDISIYSNKVKDYFGEADKIIR